MSENYNYIQRQPWLFDEENKRYLSILDEPTWEVQKNILKKIRVLLALEQRSNRDLEWLESYRSDHISFYSKRSGLYDKAHNATWRSSCLTTANYLAGRANIPWHIKASEDKKANREMGVDESWIKNDDIFPYDSTTQLKNDWWTDKFPQEVDLPVQVLIWNNEAEKYKAEHSFILLWKDQGEYICFDQYGFWWNFRFTTSQEIMNDPLYKWKLFFKKI